MEPLVSIEQLNQLNRHAAEGVVWIICKDCGDAIECRKGESSYDFMSQIPVCANCWWNRLPLPVWKAMKGKTNEEQTEIARPHLLAMREQELIAPSA